MQALEFVSTIPAALGNASLRTARVIDASASGGIVIVDAQDESSPFAAEPLHTADGTSLTLIEGDMVLVWRHDSTSPAVVLGRIGPQRERVPAADIPDELVIEARENLTLKCGDGSITIRADGKILIKGKDLVSHAQRTNRIKGGSVAIN
jgi:hypothetical protein